MNNRIIIGIDLGTSYSKICAGELGKNSYTTFRIRSPQPLHDKELDVEFYQGKDWWDTILDLIKSVDSEYSLNNNEVTIFLSGIAPALTVFDMEEPHNAYCLGYWSYPGKNPSAFSDNDEFRIKQEITYARVRTLEKITRLMKIKKPGYSDLVGYINWMLSGILTINTTVSADMGLRSQEEINEVFKSSVEHIKLGAPLATIKSNNLNYLRNNHLTVCYGCSDSIGSIFSAGLENKDDDMIYLGTFGSYVKIQRPMQEILYSPSCSEPSYKWFLSIPELGPFVERYSQTIFNTSNPADSLNMFNESAASCSSGANGTLLLLPRWGSNLVTLGEYSFVFSRLDGMSLASLSRAIQEGIAYAVLSVMDESSKGKYLTASGGGTKSKIWLQAVSNIVTREIIINRGTADAGGSFALATMSQTKETPKYEMEYKVNPDENHNDDVKSNISKSADHYLKMKT